MNETQSRRCWAESKRKTMNCSGCYAYQTRQQDGLRHFPAAAAAHICIETIEGEKIITGRMMISFLLLLLLFVSWENVISSRKSCLLCLFFSSSFLMWQKGKKVSLRIYIWAARQLLPPNIIHMTFSPTEVSPPLYNMFQSILEMETIELSVLISPPWQLNPIESKQDTRKRIVKFVSLFCLQFFEENIIRQ